VLTTKYGDKSPPSVLEQIIFFTVVSAAAYLSDSQKKHVCGIFFIIYIDFISTTRRAYSTVENSIYTIAE
jgi:hypothetical protein